MKMQQILTHAACEQLLALRRAYDSARAAWAANPSDADTEHAYGVAITALADFALDAARSLQKTLDNQTRLN